MEVRMTALAHQFVGRRSWFAAILLSMLVSLAGGYAVAAPATSANPLQPLHNRDTFIDPAEITNGDATQSDLARLDAAASDAASRGVHEKLAVLSGFAPGTSTERATARYIRRY